jgi:hypothetical protein
VPEKFIATRMYMKPLMPGKTFDQGDPQALLNKARRDLMRRVKQELQQTAFSPAAKKSLAKSIKIEIKPSSLQVTSTHPAFAPLVKGQKREQMRWLMKAERPIPIITEKGELIFRWASPRSMRDGRWIHPGRTPSSFIDRAKATSREFLKEKFRKELSKSVRKAWSKR